MPLSNTYDVLFQMRWSKYFLLSHIATKGVKLIAELRSEEITTMGTQYDHRYFTINLLLYSRIFISTLSPYIILYLFSQAKSLLLHR